MKENQTGQKLNKSSLLPLCNKLLFLQCSDLSLPLCPEMLPTLNIENGIIFTVCMCFMMHLISKDQALSKHYNDMTSDIVDTVKGIGKKKI